MEYALGALVLIPFLIIVYRLNARHGDWRPAYFSNRMKRFFGGSWQYRDMTQDEKDARADQSIW